MKPQFSRATVNLNSSVQIEFDYLTFSMPNLESHHPAEWFGHMHVCYCVYRQPVSLGGVPNVPNGVSSGPHSLGPPTNCLNRSRSRSPSHLNDRRSVSPNFPRKHLSVPASRSRSPTPNYTSTYTTKLTTKRGSQGTNHYSGPHSLPYEPYTPAPKAKYVTTAQYQTEPKSVRMQSTCVGLGGL